MKNPDKFEVIVITKIPYLTKVLGTISVLTVIFLVITIFPLIPSKHSTHEVQILYYMTIMPDFLITLQMYAGFTLIISLPLYFKIRKKHICTLIFDADVITLHSKSYNKDFNTSLIKSLYCYDPLDSNGYPKQRFTLQLKMWNGTATRIRLKNYDQADRLIDLLTVYENENLEVFSTRYISDINDE